jgi:hypothetical protein
LNFGNFFFAKTKYSWSLKDPYNRVKLFVNACKEAKLDIKIFIDESVETDEAINKWKSRREKEVQNEEKFMPQGMSYFLGDMFKNLGVPVYYSLDEDNDDTLAFYANADGANVLSGDGDFYRYIDRKYKIYSDFNQIKLLVQQPRQAWNVYGINVKNLLIGSAIGKISATQINLTAPANTEIPQQGATTKVTTFGTQGQQ